MQCTSIWPIDRTLSGAITPGQSGPGRDDNKGVLCIPQSSSITGTLPSDYLVSYQDTRCGVGGLVGWSLTPLQRSSQCILQPGQQLNGFKHYCVIPIIHHHVVLVARISLTLSSHLSLSFIASGRSSGLHPVSSHSCWMYVRAGRPAFARPCVGVHKSTSLMSSSLLLQRCPACLIRLTGIVFVIGGRWPYSWCLVGCCRQDLFKIARSILV